MIARALLFLAATTMTVAAHASSDDAWESFRKDVKAACLKAAEPLFARANAVVDPFGSESYGLALLRGPAKGAEKTTITAICVYNKKTHAAEIGGELPPFAKGQ